MVANLGVMFGPNLKRQPTDGYPTSTSVLQSETEETLLNHIPTGSDPAPLLQKNSHLQYLVRNLLQGFPARYASQDASQPWLMYWSLHSFSILQVGIDPSTKQRAIDTIMQWQHPTGGFGGGPGQSPHLLPTYAATCSLAIVGRPGPNGGWDQIDRAKMYEFFMSLKQPDGSFLVSRDAEVDVRGIYCLLVTAHLLNILTPELIEGTAEFIASLQTYEGGFASASHPYFSPEADGSSALLPSPRPPLGEAHGGYTFCALASWIMLRPLLSAQPNSNTSPRINLHALLRWLVQMQGSEIELGGFRGRTNKLVDGCYSWWVGGAFSLLEALGVGCPHEREHKKVNKDDDDSDWADIDDSLHDRKALQEYILHAGQHSAGGLRDKPPKLSDSYHTLYCLAGLSSAQHRVFPSQEHRATIWRIMQDESSDAIRRTAFSESLSWIEEEGMTRHVGGKANNVNATHPIFNLTVTHTQGIMEHFYQQKIPQKIATAGPK